MPRHWLKIIAFLLLSTSPAYADGTINGTLMDEHEQPQIHTDILLQDGQGKRLSKTTSDAEGHFHFPSMPPGIYVMEAVEKDAILGSSTVSVDDEDVHQDLTLQSEKILNIIIAKGTTDSRNNLSPKTGTNAYKMDSKAIAALPQGDASSLDKILEQAPGVAEDSFGQVHVRGEHADLQYRLNGILLPEGISGFGQTLDPRIIQNMTLLDGILPAQYGYRTAGVVDIQAKTGYAKAGQIGFYGGSYGTINPSFNYSDTWNNTDLFLNITHLSSDFGIEPPTSSSHPIHDHTEQNKQFIYTSYMIDSTQRLELIAGNSISYFQIPNNPGQTPQFTDGSISSFDSSQLNERQFESNQFATVAWQGQINDLEIQVAPYFRTSETHFRPDPVGDLVFNGVASNVAYKDLAIGLQNDNSWRMNADHTLRAGFQIQDEHIVSDNSSQVFSTFPTLSTTPETIDNDNQRHGQLYGFYLQDEWKLSDKLTMNYGARFDLWNAYMTKSQLSPRLNFVYKADDATTLHAGYARYFTPPSLEFVAPNTIAAFANTTNAPSVTNDAPVKPERTHAFDIGATHQLTSEIKLSVDAYYKIVHDLLDEGQFGQALVFTPFNYAQGKMYGAEATLTYQTKDWMAYANFAAARAVGRNIVSAQFNFNDPAELAYIQNHWVHLDHDQRFTASAGTSYRIFSNTTFNFDGTFGSGLREGFANRGTLDPYAIFDASITQELKLFPHDKTALRFAIVNVFDTPYELRSGTGIGVGQPQWGMRRGFFIGLTQEFNTMPQL